MTQDKKSCSPCQMKNQSEEVIEVSLYEKHQTIQNRHVKGWFSNWRTGMVILTQLIFYGGAWLQWDGRQAILFNIVERKFYIFGLVLWPQDVLYLAIILIISAYALFLFTAIAGRLFCGFACPQSVYTQIFMKLEYWIEGDRNARIALNKAPMSLRKFGIKSAKHGAWLAVALFTGFTFIGYFAPIRELFHDIISFEIGPWQTFWLFFYSLATYGNAGWLREQVCKHMCPYARFQSVMFDKDTLIVSYDTKRGEPRGPRKKSFDYKSAGLGECTDCGLCVQVCPTGIDIRNGLQYECIGCGLCVDACNGVMEKMGYPKGLVRYTSEHGLEKRWSFKEMAMHLVRPRIIIYTIILMAIITAFFVSLYQRNPVKVNILRDRSAILRVLPGGVIENVYQVRIMNADTQSHQFTIKAEGIEGAQILNIEQPLISDAESTQTYVMTLRVPGKNIGYEEEDDDEGYADQSDKKDKKDKKDEKDEKEHHKKKEHHEKFSVRFIITQMEGDKRQIEEKSTFIAPIKK